MRRLAIYARKGRQNFDGVSPAQRRLEENLQSSLVNILKHKASEKAHPVLSKDALHTLVCAAACTIFASAEDVILPKPRCGALITALENSVVNGFELRRSPLIAQHIADLFPPTT
jgi:hypothetical protein